MGQKYYQVDDFSFLKRVRLAIILYVEAYITEKII